MKITILGSGGSTGTPSVEYGWGDCDPDNPKNRRLRPGIYVENDDGQSILIDTGPDLREQLLTHNIRRVDGILYTHAHADHTHGIDDVRSLNRLMQKAIPAYMSAETYSRLKESFPWIFEKISPTEGFYKPTLDKEIIKPVDYKKIAGMDISFFEQSHGYSKSTGIQIKKDFVLTTDVVDISDEAILSYKGVKHWVVGMIGFSSHPTHAHYDLILEWAERIEPQYIWLTHLGIGLDHQWLVNDLPDNIRPAYDGLVIEV